MAGLQTCDKMDNFDKKCYHVTLSEPRNDSKIHLIITY